MDLHHHIEEPQFFYDRAHVQLSYERDGDLHAILISIGNLLVNRMLFVSHEEALNYLHNLKLALHLGAKFNDEGYWKFELPPTEKLNAQAEYYRRAKL